MGRRAPAKVVPAALGTRFQGALPADDDVSRGMAGADPIDTGDGDDLDTLDGGGAVDDCGFDPGDTVVGC